VPTVTASAIGPAAGCAWKVTAAGARSWATTPSIQTRPATAPSGTPSRVAGTATIAACVATERRTRPGVAPIARTRAMSRACWAMVAAIVTPTMMIDR
jgi:hypothetical protein